MKNAILAKFPKQPTPATTLPKLLLQSSTNQLLQEEAGGGQGNPIGIMVGVGEFSPKILRDPIIGQE